MPAVNGVTSPLTPGESPTTAVSATKRKRSGSDDAVKVNGVHHADTKSADAADKRLRGVLADVEIVLRKYDTNPSILDQPLPESHSKSSAQEPSSKRAKLSDAQSIGKKLEQKAYASVNALQQDVEAVTAEMLAPLQAKETAVIGSVYGAPSQLSYEESQLWTGVLAFQKVSKTMAEHEATHNTVSNDSSHDATPNGEDQKTNGVKQEADQPSLLTSGRNVLTVYAAAPQPRQLFSSFQQPVSSHDLADSKVMGTEIKVTVPLREGGLPTIISATTIPQLPLADAASFKKLHPTIGERFAPPRSLPPLEPPQPSKQTTTKSNILGFVSNDDLVRKKRRSSYNWSGSSLTVGQWLGYGGVEPSQQPTSPEAKRKQRDRALSTGEARPAPSRSELLAHERAKEDAMFRKVYSNFAPTHDDSGAIVPKQVKNEMWWHKVGRARAQQALLIDPDLPAFGEPVASELTSENVAEEEKMFQEAVENFDASMFAAERPEQQTGDKDTDALLEDVTDLVETLYSFQLIRNMSVSKPQTREAQEITKKNIGTPSTPSEAEVEVYKTLRAQLMLLISNLPPYLLSRLDGDRLKDLNISGNILVETSDERGVMEEDLSSRMAKQTTMTAAVTSHTAGRPSAASTYAAYSQTATQYNRTPGAQSHVARTPTSANYLPHTQTAARPSALPFQRTSTGGHPQTAAYAAAAARGGYQPSPAAQFAQTPGRPGASTYLQQLQQLSGSNRTAASQYHASTPQSAAANRGYYAQSPVAVGGFAPQQRSNGSTYTNYPPQSPHQRVASPLNVTGTVGPAAYGAINRQPYASPGGQVRSQYVPGTGPPPQYSNPSSFTPSLPPTNAEQQSAIRAQLAAQAQARLAAAANQSSPNKLNSGTPQQQQSYQQSPSTGTAQMVAQKS